MPDFIEKVGYNPTSVAFVPISGWHGDNMIAASTNMAGTRAGPLRGRRARPDRLSSSLPLASTLWRCTTSPFLRPPPETTLASKSRTCLSKRQEWLCHLRLEEQAGDLGRFQPQDIFLNHPRQVFNGYSLVFDCHTTHIDCKFGEILKTINSHTGKSIEDVPKFIKSKYAAIVKLFPSKPMWVESFSEFPPLGRFSARDMRQTFTAAMAWRRPLTLTLTLTSPRRVSSCPSSPKR